MLRPQMRSKSLSDRSSSSILRSSAPTCWTGPSEPKIDASRPEAADRFLDRDERSHGRLEMDAVEPGGQLDGRHVGRGESHVPDDQLEPPEILEQHLQRVQGRIAVQDHMRVKRQIAMNEVVAQLLHLRRDEGHAVDDRAELESGEAAGERLVPVFFHVIGGIDVEKPGKLRRIPAKRGPDEIVVGGAGGQRLPAAQEIRHAERGDHAPGHQHGMVDPGRRHVVQREFDAGLGRHQMAMRVDDHCSASLRSTAAVRSARAADRCRRR